MSASILALDVGERRIGVAVADTVAGIACPLTTLEQHTGAVDDIADLVAEHRARAVVVGLPRGLDGQRTQQVAYTEAFTDRLHEKLTVPLYWQDESVTSRQAERELQTRGKPYTKADIDALAAMYILEDFLASSRRDKL